MSRDDTPMNTVLPYHEEAEDRVVAAAITSKRALDQIAETISPDHMYQPRHARILQAALRLADQDLPIDIVSLSEHLAPDDTATALELANAGYPTTNAYHHARIVKDYATRRKLIKVGQEIARTGWEPPDTIDDALGTAETLVYELTTSSDPGDLRPVKDTLAATFEHLRRPPAEITGTPIGLSDFDKQTAGLQPGNLVIVAARPGQGKSALALAAVRHAAVKLRKPVALFTLEMSAQEINQRLLSVEARVPLMSIRTRFGLTEHHHKALVDAGSVLHDAPLFVDDTVGARLIDIRSRARRLKAKNPDLALVVVDYLQLMLGDGKAENRNLEVARISRGLKLLARELETPVMALAQLNRQVENRGHGAKPMLADLRDSGAIEQDADVVVFIHRDPDKADDNVCELLIAKHRNGPTAAVSVVWLKQRATFANLQETA